MRVANGINRLALRALISSLPKILPTCLIVLLSPIEPLLPQLEKMFEDEGAPYDVVKTHTASGHSIKKTMTMDTLPGLSFQVKHSSLNSLNVIKD